MPSLNWIGKDKIENHDKEVAFRLMKKNEKLSLGKNSENLIVEGDNLEALKALMPHYVGKVKCIYIDPPYNTGNESWTYNDKVNSSRIKEWLEQTVGIDDLERHDKWLCMMYPRLKLLKELLSEDGAIYMQLDYNEAHHGKILMDEIFGPENFQREIIWRIGWLSGYKTIEKNYIRNHDTILFYSKNAKKLEFFKNYNKQENYLERFNGQSAKELLQYFKNIGLNKKKSSEALKFATKVGLPDRYPLEDTWNSSPYDKLNSIAIVSFSGEKVSKLLNVEEFKGQKSVDLVKRIIKAHTKENDIVLDSFGGTGTTGHAVLELNKEDGGNRKFILVELEKDIAQKITSQRIRKISKNLNGSFEYVTLGDPLFESSGAINQKVSFKDLASYVYFMETHTNINLNKIKDNFIGEYNGQEFYLLFKDKDKNILNESSVKKIWKSKLPKIVYADKCLIDQAKLDKLGIIFKQIPYSVKTY